MTFSCTICNYSTKNKSNYNKHLKCNKHLNNMNSQKIDLVLYASKKHTYASQKVLTYRCDCGRDFHHSSSLTRHKHSCLHTQLDKMKQDLKKQFDVEIKQMEMEIENKLLKQQLEEYNKTVKTINTTTFNISIKKYIQQNYSDAPPLKKLDDYSIIEKNNCDSDLIDNIVHHYNHKNLDQYLGDFIVKYYKKDNYTQQSIWNSDASRMTYIIKELMDNKKSLWNHDYKGVKTKEYIIHPLLQYIKRYITNYINNFVLDVNNLTTKDYQDIVEKQLAIAHIIQYIDNDLADNIVRYIAPYFHLIKDNEDILLTNCDS